MFSSYSRRTVNLTQNYNETNEIHIFLNVERVNDI